MILNQFDEVMVLVFGIWFLVQGILFGMIWQTSRRGMVGRQRTRLSNAQHDLYGGWVIVSFSVGMLFVFRWIAGPVDDATWAYDPVRVAMRAIMLIGLVIVTWAGVRVAGALRERWGIYGETEEAVNVRQDSRGVTQDQRENEQNDEDENLEVRRIHQDEREKLQDQRDIDRQDQ